MSSKFELMNILDITGNQYHIALVEQKGKLVENSLGLPCWCLGEGNSSVPVIFGQLFRFNQHKSACLKKHS